MPPKPVPVIDRMMSRRNVTANGCWEYTGSRRPDGYGVIGMGGRGGRIARVHRVAYEHFTGPIPDGLDIDHACHNRACFNPAHLRIATRSENNQNQVRARSDSRSGVRGVCWHKQNKKWHAQGSISGRTYSLGFFDAIHEAESAVVAWRREHYPYSAMDQTTNKEKAA